MTVTKSLSTALIDGTGAITPANVTVSTNTMTVGTAMYVVANGNVGVGYNSPGQKLVVNGNIATLSGDNRYLQLASNTNYYWRVSAVADDFSITDATSTASLWIKYSTGYLGIGTSSPASKLHVKSSGSIGIFESTATTGSCYLDFKNANSSPSLGYIGYGSSGNEILTINNYKNDAVQIYANSGFVAYFGANGNVGIGTNSPTSKLYVYGGSITSGTASSTTGSILLQGVYGAGSITNFGTEYSSGGPVIGYGVTPSTSSSAAFVSSSSAGLYRGAYTIAGYTHYWYSGGLQTVAVGSAVTCPEQMRLDGAGNLGVGSTDAGGKTASFGKIVAVQGNDSALVLKSTYGTGSTWSIQSYNGDLAFWNGVSSNTKRFNINDSGYVTMPYQPAFHATSGSAATTAGNVVVFPTVVTNIGSGYNSTNGRFTAPVAGTYLFIFSYLKDAGNTDTYTSIRKNGSALANMDCTGSNYTPGAIHAIATLAVNDYVDCYVNGGTVYVSYRQFSGYLIG